MVNFFYLDRDPKICAQFRRRETYEDYVSTIV